MRRKRARKLTKRGGDVTPTKENHWIGLIAALIEETVNFLPRRALQSRDQKEGEDDTFYSAD